MWYALHGYIHDFKAIDDYLQHRFPAVIQNDMERFFFIRYWLGGPHIRLRFEAAEKDYPVIKARFEQSIASYLETHDIQLIDYDNYYQKTMLENEAIQETYWCPNGSVEAFTYHPEYERYGGREGMTKSEKVFYRSSQMALILNKLSFAKRIMAGLDLIFLTFSQSPAGKDIYRSYASMWESYAKEDTLSIDLEHTSVLSKRLHMLIEEGPERFTVYHDYLDCLKETGIMDDIELLISHVHMTNNRLGVTPVLEYELATFIDKHKGWR